MRKEKVKKEHLHTRIDLDTLYYLRLSALNNHISISKQLYRMIVLYSSFKPRSLAFLEKQAVKEHTDINVLLRNIVEKYIEEKKNEIKK